MPQRRILPFNTHWMFSPRDDRDCARPGRVAGVWTEVHLPHNNLELPATYFSEKRTQFVSWYRKRFRLPGSLRARRIFIDFDGVMMAAVLTVTGPATLVGPNPCSLAGGVAGLYLRAGLKPGTVRLHAQAEGLGECEGEGAGEAVLNPSPLRHSRIAGSLATRGVSPAPERCMPRRLRQSRHAAPKLFELSVAVRYTYINGVKPQHRPNCAEKGVR